MQRTRKMTHPLNYSGRHAGEIVHPADRAREYHPSESTHGMIGGRSIRDLRSINPKEDNKMHGIAYESTKRQHID